MSPNGVLYLNGEEEHLEKGLRLIKIGMGCNFLGLDQCYSLAFLVHGRCVGALEMLVIYLACRTYKQVYLLPGYEISISNCTDASHSSFWSSTQMA